jgi:hypothetical protein
MEIYPYKSQSYPYLICNIHDTTIIMYRASPKVLSQNYLNDLAKETLPFMYQTSIEGIRDVIKECWSIYQNDQVAISTTASTITGILTGKACTPMADLACIPTSRPYN